MMGLTASKQWLTANWFLPAFAAVLAGSWAFARSAAFLEAGGEAALLADLCITVPILYLLCYRKTVSAPHLAIRMMALACLGIWVAARLIPAESQTLLPHLGWARWLGLAVLALIELRLLFAAVRLVFSGTATAEEVSARTGAPPFIARLMLLEARFWRWIWSLIRPR